VSGALLTNWVWSVGVNQIFRFNWKLRRNSPSKVPESNHEEATVAALAGSDYITPKDMLAGRQQEIQAEAIATNALLFRMP
jgi:hypothetical protein